jgi:hypothetical protein
MINYYYIELLKLNVCFKILLKISAPSFSYVYSPTCTLTKELLDPRKSQCETTMCTLLNNIIQLPSLFDSSKAFN